MPRTFCTAPLAGQVTPQIPLDRPAPKVTISLAEALGQGRANSPAYRQALNDAGPAGVSVRNAWGQLLPTLGVGGNIGYTGEGKSTFGGETFNQVSAAMTSGYGVQLDLRLSGSTILGPGTQKANQRAVEEDIASAGNGLNNDITVSTLGPRRRPRRTWPLAVGKPISSCAGPFPGRQATSSTRQAEVTKAEAQPPVAMQNREQAVELLRRIWRSGLRHRDGLSDCSRWSSPGSTQQPFEADGKPTPRALRPQDASRASQRCQPQYLPSLSATAAWPGHTRNSPTLTSVEWSGASPRSARHQNLPERPDSGAGRGLAIMVLTRTADLRAERHRDAFAEIRGLSPAQHLRRVQQSAVSANP
jgi:hypothetical protein